MEDTIPRPVIERTIDILSGQSHIPLSPADRDVEGKVNLCLAGAIAKAGFQILRSESHAKAFEDELERTGSKRILEQAFEHLGWDIEICRNRVALNDRINFAIRKEAILQYLEDCLTQSR